MPWWGRTGGGSCGCGQRTLIDHEAFAGSRSLYYWICIRSIRVFVQNRGMARVWNQRGVDGGWFGSEGKKRFETKIHYYLSVHIMYSSYTEAQIVILFRRSRRCVVEVQFCGSYKGVKRLEECVCVLCVCPEEFRCSVQMMLNVSTSPNQEHVTLKGSVL